MAIVTRPATKEYRDNFDATFGKKRDSPKSAALLSDGEIAAELADLGKKWDAFTASDDEGHGGSPGEWMVERMDELETEQKRRAR